MLNAELPPWEGPEDDWNLSPRVRPTWTPRGEALKERRRKGKYQQALFNPHGEMPYYQNIIQGGNY